MSTVSLEVNVDVDVNDVLEKATNQELFDELDRRGYTVSRSLGGEDELSEEEIEILVNKVIDYKPGTIGNVIYEKIRKK